MNQVIQKKEDQCILDIEVIEGDCRMSWSRSKVGTHRFRAQTHKGAEWVMLTMAETPEGGACRQTMVTLWPEAAKALYQQLHAVYGEDNK